MGFSPTRSSNKKTPKALTDMQRQYEAETGSTMFSRPKSPYGGRNPQRRKSERQAYASWEKTTAGMNAGKDRFNAMMANRSQNPVLGQTQAGMSGFDKYQAMQAGKDNLKTNPRGRSLPGGFYSDVANLVLGGLTPRADNSQAGYDKFQAMQAARDAVKSNRGYNPALEAFSDILAAKGDPRSIFSGAVEKYRNRNSGQQPGYDRFQSQMGANPLILQQLQMGQRQMGPQFNAFGFGAQPGLAAQGGQGGSMLANMSSQGMNQLAAGQQNNPTIFKAKS
jgi:hypothetical protein